MREQLRQLRLGVIGAMSVACVLATASASNAIQLTAGCLIDMAGNAGGGIAGIGTTLARAEGARRQTTSRCPIP